MAQQIREIVSVSIQKYRCICQWLLYSAPMKPAGPVLEELYDAVDAHETEDQNRVLRTLNLAYYEMASLAPWAEMRASVQVQNGSWLPANIVDINSVYDSDGNLYHHREKSNTYLGVDDPVLRFYFQAVRSTPLAEGRGLTVTQGSATISFSPAQSAAEADAFMTIEGLPGFWKLASATSIVDTYHGPTKQGAWYQIGPVGQKQIALIDETGTVDSGTVTIDYWAYPRPIFGPNDIILLPKTEALLLRTLRRYYKITKKDLPRGVSFNDEYQTALDECLGANPRYAAPSFPRRLDGQPMGWGASLQ
jgi:hypothetical protein